MKMNKRYDSIALRNFMRKAVAEKGSDFQREILSHILDGKNFVEWLDGQINVPTKGEEIPFPAEPRRLSTSQYVRFTEETALVYYSAWKNDVSLSDAATPAFWAYITRRAIAEGKMTSHDMVLSPRYGSTEPDAGKDLINETFNDLSGEEQSKQMDNLVRNFARNLSGLYLRGTRSVYQNCPFARAWWQCRIAESTSQNNWQQVILPMLRDNTIWEEMSAKMVSQLAVVGDLNIRNGIILHLLEQKSPKKDIYNLLAGIGVMSGWCALGYFSPEEIKGKIAELFA